MAKGDIVGKGKETQFSSSNQPDPKKISNGIKVRSSQRKGLKNLINDISKNKNKKITVREKQILYELYNIALTDYAYIDNIYSSINHLYFFKSDFGIKIGVSKNVNNRLKNIQEYAPSSKILKVIPYAGNFESETHKRFKKQNIKNNPVYGQEWFYVNDDLLDFINRNDDVNDLIEEFSKKIPKQLKLEF